ncbi:MULTISPECIES: cyclic nucleotide-binding domain-containing protein [Thiothrix]|jgi:CRP-like cAMP-binding protein|uniref:Cyclic nucleotide-binding domain-containing protein n=1 Tax=Thiothrix unzii TaxID=111769 RepID=A0A975IGP1_9GAMM|nr:MULTISPECIES: cyclic nucleotide-binding domain-containing protein [Thiothrix]MDX9987546.1 cyclic nucleotide-binding domain-containing protein [Thiothrix unzii]QTR53047.1 cyclic nucleotide-binding domain-containing protein [Thiothrix unzii]
MNKVSTQLVEQVKDTCHEFCAALTDEEVSRFVRYTRIREMGSQEVVADIGEISDRFYLVIGGSIKLLQVDGEKEFEVGRIEPGCLVGEMSFFDRQPRTVRLRARRSGVRLLEINRQMYNRIRIEEPYIATNLLEFVIRSLDSLVRHLSDENAKLHKQVTGLGYR